MQDKKVLKADHVEKGDFTVVLDAEEKDNPRLKINVPANSGFFEITETTPPFLIIVTRADNPITSKGLLAHAKDALFLLEHKLNKLTALTLGVGDAAGKPLTQEEIKKKLAEGVH